MTNTQNENVLLHAGRSWSEETKQRVREARKDGFLFMKCLRLITVI